MNPILIIGQGLIGTLLGWSLASRNIPFLIVDDDRPGSASKVAAGLINPIMGPRLKLVENGEKMLPFALQTYESIGKKISETLFEPRTLLRIFDTQEQAERYEALKNNQAYAHFFANQKPPNTYGNDPFGSVEVMGGGALRIPILLEKSRALWQSEGKFLKCTFDYNLKPSGEGWFWKGKYYSEVFFAEGFGAKKNPFFNDQPLQPTQGEILTIQTPLPPTALSQAWIKKHWLLPIDRVTCKVGATYVWTEDPSCTPDGLSRLLAAFKNFLPQVFMPMVIERQSGIRMCTPNTKPTVTEHETQKNLFLINGFGSKGALFGPWLINQFLSKINK
jgi:glycine oxidase